jgi:hypothetical protein
VSTLPVLSASEYGCKWKGECKMKRWQRVWLGLGLLAAGSQLSKNSHPKTELGAAISLLVSFSIIIWSFWLFFGKIKKDVDANK